MSVRSASRGSPAARSIRFALRTSSIVATSSASFMRCVLRCFGRRCLSSALRLAAISVMPFIVRFQDPPRADALNHTPIRYVNNVLSELMDGKVVNACFYLGHTGCQWRALPSDFGPHQTVRTWYDRFRTDGVWAQAGADLTRRVRQAHGHTSEPTTGLLDSQSVVSGPQQGERGYDGNKKIRGIKRHVLSCSLGFVLAVVVTPASVHDTKAAEMALDRAVENGFTIKRAKVDAIYTGPTINAVSGLYKSSSRFPHARPRSKASPRCRY